MMMGSAFLFSGGVDTMVVVVVDVFSFCSSQVSVVGVVEWVLLFDGVGGMSLL